MVGATPASRRFPGTLPVGWKAGSSLPGSGALGAWGSSTRLLSLSVAPYSKGTAAPVEMGCWHAAIRSAEQLWSTAILKTDQHLLVPQHYCASMAEHACQAVVCLGHSCFHWLSHTQVPADLATGMHRWTMQNLLVRPRCLRTAHHPARCLRGCARVQGPSRREASLKAACQGERGSLLSI